MSQLNPGLGSIANNSEETGYYQNAAPATLYSLSDVNRSYSMVLTSYVQAYVYGKLSGTAPAAFVFSPMLRNSGALGLDRAVLDGKNIKLRVYYSSATGKL